MRALLRFPEVGILSVAVLLVVFFTATTGGGWLAVANLKSVLQVMSVLAVMGIGAALVITIGEIDISLGSVFAMAAFTYLGAADRVGTLIAALLALFVAAAIGALNGYLVGYLRIPSLVVTLGTLFTFRGVALAVTESGYFFSASTDMRSSFVYGLLGGGRIFGLSTAVLWLVIVATVVHLYLLFTPGGNRLLAVGGDAASAHSRGVGVRRIKLGAFVASAVLAGFAGLLEASNIGVAEGSFGRLMELEAIAAAVLGGCVLGGGRASIWGTVLGAFVLTSIQSYLIVAGIDSQWYILLLGLLVVAATLANRLIVNAAGRIGRRRTGLV